MIKTIKGFLSAVALICGLGAHHALAAGVQVERSALPKMPDGIWRVQSHAGPSYSCAGQLPPVATTICNDATLSYLDRQMSAAYSAALPQNPGLQSSQQAWIGQLTQCNTSVPCIQQQYLARISAITGQQVVLQQGQASATPAATGTGSSAQPFADTPLIKVLSTEGQASYYGAVTCGRDHHQFALAIKNIGGGKLTAEMNHFYRWSSSGRHKLETLVGEYDPQTNSISFVRDNEQLHAVRWLGNKIIVVQDGIRPEFSIQDAQCKDGSMYRFDPRRISAPPGPGTQAAFFQAPDPRRRCEVLVQWLSQQDTLFDPKIPDGSRNYAKLYVDELFVPVFGVPYDKLSTKMLNEAFRINPSVSRNYNCYNEPFVKEKWRKLERLHGEGFRGGHHKVYIDWYVRRQRSVLRDVVSAMGQAKDVYAVNGVSSFLSKEEMNEFLSPAKIKALEGQLKDLKAQRAFADASEYMNALNGKTVRGQFEQVNVYRKSKPAFHRWLTPEGMRQMDDNLRVAFEHTANRLLKPVLSEITQQPQTLEGLVAARAMIDKSVVGAVSDYSRDLPLVDAIRADQSAREMKISKALEAQIAGFKPDVAGLKASIDWVEALKGDVAKVLPQKQVSALRKAWEANRETLLEQAVPAFEAQIKGVSGAAADEILKTYLHPKYDMSRPIALEYELIALSN